MGQEDSVDSASACTGEDVYQHPKFDFAPIRDGLKKPEVDRVAARVGGGFRLSAMKDTAGLGHPPDFLGDPVHVDRETDSAVADQGNPEFLFPHPEKR